MYTKSKHEQRTRNFYWAIKSQFLDRRQKTYLMVDRPTRKNHIGKVFHFIPDTRRGAVYRHKRGWCTKW